VFQVERDGRFVKLRPVSGALVDREGWLVLEHTAAQRLIEQLGAERAAEADNSYPDEDG